FRRRRHFGELCLAQSISAGLLITQDVAVLAGDCRDDVIRVGLASLVHAATLDTAITRARSSAIAGLKAQQAEGCPGQKKTQAADRGHPGPACRDPVGAGSSLGLHRLSSLRVKASIS